MPGSRTLESGDSEFGGHQRVRRSELDRLLEGLQRWKLARPGGARAAAFPRWRSISSKRYPYSSLAINDQIRAEEFIREFNEREKANDIPQLSIPRSQ